MVTILSRTSPLMRGLPARGPLPLSLRRRSPNADWIAPAGNHPGEICGLGPIKGILLVIDEVEYVLDKVNLGGIILVYQRGNNVEPIRNVSTACAA